jgi:hypothetical protein
MIDNRRIVNFYLLWYDKRYIHKPQSILLFTYVTNISMINSHKIIINLKIFTIVI